MGMTWTECMGDGKPVTPKMESTERAAVAVR